MRSRAELQPTTSATSTATQEMRFAVQLGNAKTVQAFVNVHANTGASGSTDIEFVTATSPDLGSDSFWIATPSTAGKVTIAAGFTGVKTVTLSELADVLRWRIPTFGGGTLTFSIVIFMQDT